ncbi:MAG: cation-transporting P-type ATPase [Ruminococcaceae bacterium]|nr:cation-transporting P-type ATPase [Oscillospiraceae bacterium]
MNEKWFLLSIAEIEKKLKTNAASGLTRKAARSAWYRISHKNGALFITQRKSFRKMLGEILSDFSLIMLLLASLFAILFDEGHMGWTVMIIASVSLIFSFVLYHNLQRSMEQVNLYFLPTAKVIRGGKLYRISFDNVVPGDVIILEKGDIVCADARLVTSDSLKVSMRVNKGKYIPLDKQSNGVVSQEENDPAKFVNTLHGGSVITEGSARAIVYATGKYTYLGAMTGGIVEPYNNNIPAELRKMRKMCARISMFSLIAILPFCAVSILLSKMTGEGAVLSSTFLTALAIAASSMTQLSCTLYKVFFISKIKNAFNEKSAVAIRTTDAFDKLYNTSYLFMLDGASVTDGILHFDTAFTAEGEVAGAVKPSASVKTLLELSLLYNISQSNMLAAGINSPDKYKTGLEEFISKGNFDAQALKLRCQVKSFISGTTKVPSDQVIYTDAGRQTVLCVSRSSNILSECSHALISGSVQPLSSIGTDKLRHTYELHAAKGKTVLFFTLSTPQSVGNTTGKIFVGGVVLREGVDKNAYTGILDLQKKGIKVISFVGSELNKNAPQIPIEFHSKQSARKQDFINNGVPITYKFGEINTYYDMSLSDIELLLDHAHKNGESVAVVSFTEASPTIMKAADVLISCSPLVDVFSAKNEEELYTLEMAGSQTSASCEQVIKSKSDVLLSRPWNNKGGISSLASALSFAEAAHKNLISFFKYMLCAQLLRIILVALPMAFGTPALDARHVVLCSFLIDILVLLMLASDKTQAPSAKRHKYGMMTLKMHILSENRLLICALASGIVAITLPVLMNAVGVFGQLLYDVEYYFCATVWLHLVLAYYIRFQSVLRIKHVLKNKYFLGLTLGTIAFISLISIVNSIGVWFNVDTHQLPYFIASFVPSIVFSVTYEIFIFSRKTHKRK